MSGQLSLAEGIALRKGYLDKARRVVVKVGSAVLTGSSGLDRPTMENLARQLAALRHGGREVILVSSGAVAAGRRKLGVTRKTLALREKQAVAAAGQSHLMRCYEDIFAGFDQNVAQLLLTRDDLSQRGRYLNVRNTLLTLLEWGLIPIINENDTVSVEELRFGDNDTLGAMITNLIEADLFVVLSDVDGLYTANPLSDPGASKIATVTKVSAEIEAMAGKVGSSLGTGGMLSKIHAAKTVAARGGCSFIGPGRQGNVLEELFAGEPVGTFFLPAAAKLLSRKHWIAFTLKPQGELVLDEGACLALSRGGKSLLPSGIIEVRGRFGLGAPVQCLNREGKAVAVGLVNYRAAEVELIKGAHSNRIEEILGFNDSDEVIHRDNLVLL